MSLNHLASLLQAQGDLAGARPLFERALAIDKKVYGSDHPEVAADLNNLALLLQAQGDLAGARPLHERSIAMREALGPEHPDTARSLNNLASLLQAQGDFGGARLVYERALAILQKALGPEHPATILVRNNLANLRRAESAQSNRRGLSVPEHGNFRNGRTPGLPGVPRRPASPPFGDVAQTRNSRFAMLCPHAISAYSRSPPPIPSVVEKFSLLFCSPWKRCVRSV